MLRQPHLHSELDAVRHGLDLVQVQLRLRLAGRHDELRQRRLQLRHGDLVELDPQHSKGVSHRKKLFLGLFEHEDQEKVIECKMIVSIELY